MNIVYPKDHSSSSIQGLVDAADSDVIFVGDPSVDLEPEPRMFNRMARVIRETGCGWVYADAAGHPRIDYQSGSPECRTNGISGLSRKKASTATLAPGHEAKP